MGQEVADRITPCTAQEMLDALAAAWPAVVGSLCTNTDSVRLLCAQWAMETGWGKACHCNNIGNAKAVVGGSYDWCFFATDEIINGRLVKFNPPNPGCCFRAFATLREGVVDHLHLLTRQSNFASAWPFVLAGDAAGFCRALKIGGYYTADEGQYTRAVVSIFGDLHKLTPVTPSKNDCVAAELTYRDLLLIVGDAEDL